jgi:hypothetical protein
MQNPRSTHTPQRDFAPLRLVHAARPTRTAWAGSLPMGEFLLIAAFGLVLILS